MEIIEVRDLVRDLRGPILTRHPGRPDGAGGMAAPRGRPDVEPGECFGRDYQASRRRHFGKMRKKRLGQLPISVAHHPHLSQRRPGLTQREVARCPRDGEVMLLDHFVFPPFVYFLLYDGLHSSPPVRRPTDESRLEITLLHLVHEAFETLHVLGIGR